MLSNILAQGQATAPQEGGPQCSEESKMIQVPMYRLWDIMDISPRDNEYARFSVDRGKFGLVLNCLGTHVVCSALIELYHIKVLKYSLVLNPLLWYAL